jgi:diguanylate cyclase (GGDEF)-like protein
VNEDAAAEQRLAESVAAIWERFRGSNLERVDALAQSIDVLAAGRLEIGPRREAERTAHKLAGSLGTYGLTEASWLARQIELALRGQEPVDRPTVVRLKEHVSALRVEVQRPLPNAAEEPVADERLVVLIVDAEPELVKRSEPEAGARGLRLVRAPTADDALRLIEQEKPDAIVLDLAVGGTALVEEMAERAAGVPLLVSGDDSSLALADRVEVARRGGSTFLQTPVSASRLLDAVTRELERIKPREARVLAVDDDAQLLALLRSILEDGRFSVATEQEPQRFWDTLEETRPDLVILDVDMPTVNGIELCQVIRSDPRWATLPIVVLTGLRDARTVQRVFEAGADDFVTKPIAAPELLGRAAARVARAQAHQASTQADYLTGLPNRRTFERQTSPYLLLARRQHRPVAIAMLDLDNFKQVNDTYGHPAGDTVLRRLGDLLRHAFRGEDVVARWGGEEFVVALFGSTREAGVRRLTELLHLLNREPITAPDGRRFSVTFSAGVAEFSEDGADLDSLCRAADQALYLAKHAGRHRVLAYGRAPH